MWIHATSQENIMSSNMINLFRPSALRHQLSQSWSLFPISVMDMLKYFSKSQYECQRQKKMLGMTYLLQRIFFTGPLLSIRNIKLKVRCFNLMQCTNDTGRGATKMWTMFLQKVPALVLFILFFIFLHNRSHCVHNVKSTLIIEIIFYLCKAQLQEGSSVWWHKTGCCIKTAAASIILSVLLACKITASAIWTIIHNWIVLFLQNCSNEKKAFIL